jgi:hypothetical protein
MASLLASTTRYNMIDSTLCSRSTSLISRFLSRWYLWSLTGTPRNFNAIAFYLHITGMLPH